MYLHKYLSQCGVTSRRKAADLVKQGLVQVNGEVLLSPFVEVGSDDVVTYDGKVIKRQKFVYLMLNKPKGYITTCSDDRGRKTVMELIESASNVRLYPVGRLDRMTTGLLLFTNDGDLAQKLSHPKNMVRKTYRALINRPLEYADYKKLREGVTLEDGFIKVDTLRYNDRRDKRNIMVQIHSGKYRIIRRMFKFLGYKVERLDRVEYAGLTLTYLKRGEWRLLTSSQVEQLFLTSG
jgi:23S rRNA pseudouridine2605 synthase